MRSTSFWIVVIGLMLLLDFYIFQAVKVVSQGAGTRTRSIIYITYWTISVLALLTFMMLPFLHLENHSKGFRTTVFAVVVGLFFAKFAAAIFLLVDDVR